VASQKRALGKSLPPSAWLLQEISFQVSVGDRIALTGPSGAGKTSLLRLLNRLSEPTQGRLDWQGQPFGQIPVRQLRQHIALVPQESRLLGMTVQEALQYPLQLRGITPSVAQTRIAEWVERLHIPGEWLNRHELQLSVGQRQWVAIARALVTQPQVLVLDEPTSALDVGRSDQLIKVLMELSQTLQLATIMANHQLEIAEAFSDRMLHLDHGKLVQDARSSEVNWSQLRTDIRQSEAKEAQEWD
jgi:D-methionine transport system ATP-binding protein